MRQTAPQISHPAGHPMAHPIGYNIILPYRAEDTGNRGKNTNFVKAIRDTTGVPPHRVDIPEAAWNDSISQLEIIDHACTIAMRKRWMDLLFSPAVNPNYRFVFVIYGAFGQIPWDTIALGYLAAFSHPRVSIICISALARTVCSQLFVEDKKEPIKLYGSTEDYLNILGKGYFPPTEVHRSLTA